MDNFSDWSQSDEMRSITMPGPIDHMAVIGDSLYVIVRFKRRWWEFWRPSEYRRLIELTQDGLSYKRSSVI